MPEDIPSVEEQTYQAKQVAYFEAMVHGWVNTRMEKDKSLITLSAGGIGLLVTLLTTIGVDSTHQAALYVGTLLAFTVTIICLVFIFEGNANYLQEVLTTEESADGHLAILDRIAMMSFIFGVILALLIGISASFENLIETRNVRMNEGQSPGISNTDRRSLTGASNLKPIPPKSGSNQNNSGQKEK